MPDPKQPEKSDKSNHGKPAERREQSGGQGQDHERGGDSKQPDRGDNKPGKRE